MLFYKISKNKKQVELYAKSTRKYGRTQKKILPLKLAEKDYNNLNKIFKRCYDNYLESEEQIRYQNELKNKKTKKRNNLKASGFLNKLPKILNLSVTNNQTMCYFTVGKFLG